MFNRLYSITFIKFFGKKIAISNKEYQLKTEIFF